MITLEKVHTSLAKMSLGSRVGTLKMLAYDLWNVLDDEYTEQLSELALEDTHDTAENYPGFIPESDYITLGTNSPVNEDEIMDLMLDNQKLIENEAVKAVNLGLIDLEDISYLFDD